MIPAARGPGRGAAFLRLLLALAISAAGGALAQALGLPAGWLMGGAVAVSAAALAGVPFRAISTGGGSDANTLSELGLPSACLSAAMRQPHTRDEHVATADLKRLTDYLLGIIAAATRVSA